MSNPPAWVEKWIGLPFEDGGRGPDAFDCWGLVREVARVRLHAELPSWNDYASTEETEALAGLVTAAKPHFQRVEAPIEGDLVLFNVRGHACHIGLVIDAETFLHTRRGIGSALERFDSPHWARRVEGYYRCVGRAPSPTPFEPGKSDVVRVTVRPHPMREETKTIEVSACLPLSQLLPLAGLPIDMAGTCYVDGVPTPLHVIPQGGQLVSCRAVPRGRAGKIIAGVVLIIVGILLIATPFGVPLIVAGAGLIVQGILYKPPPTFDVGKGIAGPGRRQAALITGASNQPRPYAPIPRIFGYRVRYVPPLGALTYATWVGNKQHFHALFSFGYGPLRLEEHKIGDTPIAAFGMKIQAPGSAATAANNMDVREGWSNDPAVGYYLNNVSEQPMQVELTYSDDGSNTSSHRSTWSTRRSETNVHKLAIEIGFPNGLVEFNSDGTLKKLKCDIDVYYAPAGTTIPTGTGDPSSSWTPVYGRAASGNLNSYVGLHLNDNERAGFVVGLDWTVATDGQFDIIVRRATHDRSGSNQLDKSWWLKISNYRLGSPVNLSGQCTVSMDLVATGQLSGQLDSYNALASYMGPWYDTDGTTWVTPTITSTPTLDKSAQPAAHFREILQGSANKLAVADARIDLTALQDWATRTKAHGLHFNGVFESTGSVWDALQAVATTGRASFNMTNGKFSVVHDLDARTTPVQMLTPRNGGKWTNSHTWPEPIHAYLVQYVDATKDPTKGSTLSTQVVYDDGYNADGTGGKTAASLFETLTLQFCMDNVEAWKHGRRALADRRLRRDIYVGEVDIEHLVANRGNLVIAPFEAFDAQIGVFRVKTVALNGSGDCTGVTVDEKVAMTCDGTSVYKLRFRLTDGTQIEKGVGVPAAGVNQTFTFSSAIASGSPQPTVGDLGLFGLNSVTFRRCLLLRIEPMPDQGARVTLVDEAAAVYDADAITVSTTTPLVNGAVPGGGIILQVIPGTSTSPAIIITAGHGSGG